MKSVSSNPSEKISCLLCAGCHIKISRGLVADFQLARCRSCGFLFIWPRPTDSELADVYKNFTNRMEDAVISAKLSKEIVRPWHRLIQQHNLKAQKILEIGCGSGHLLFGLRHFGYQVFGCDVSEKARDLAKKDYDLDIFRGQFPPQILEKSFDVLILSHLIEHLVAPRDFLRDALRFLKPGGLLLLITPNLNSLGFRLFGRHYAIISPPVHLNFFNQDTLQRLLPSDFQLFYARTTSYDSTKRNSCFYNFFVSFLNIFKVSVRIKRSAVAVDRKIIEKKPMPRALAVVRQSIRKSLQVFAWPVFWLVDKLGWGDNILIIARKK